MMAANARAGQHPKTRPRTRRIAATFTAIHKTRCAYQFPVLLG